MSDQEEMVAPQIDPSAMQNAIFNLTISYIQMLENQSMNKTASIETVVAYLENLTNNLRNYTTQKDKNQ